MNKHRNWLLDDYHYWLPRAKRRIQSLMQYGKEYPIDPRWPNWSAADDDIGGLRETERQLYEFTLESHPADLIIASVRLEAHCKMIGKKRKD